MIVGWSTFVGQTRIHWSHLIQRSRKPSSSTDLIREYVAASRGVAVLPCYVGECDDRLARIGETRQESFAELWLLYHPRLRRLHRFRAFTEYLVDEFEHLRPLFEGESACPDTSGQRATL